MPSSNPIIVGGGAAAGSPFALNHLVYVSNVSPPQISTFNAERLLDGAVEYLAIPNSAGTYPAIAGATETLRVVGGAIIQGPANSPTSVQIGQGASTAAANTNGPIAIGTLAVATGASGGVLIGYNSGSTNGGVGIGFQVNMQQAGVCIGASAAITGSNNSFATVVGGGATAALGNVGGGYIVVVGDAASASHPGSVVIGGTATASLASNNSQNTVSIGFNATSSKSSTTVVGGSASSVQTNAVCIGAGATASNGASTNSVVIGASATTSGTYNVIVGNLSVSTANAQIIIGGGGANIGANTAQLGAPSTPIYTFVLGEGDTVATPTARTLRFTNGSGADNAAGNATIQAPLSTGAAVPAGVVISGGIVAASSSTLQTPGAIATFRQNATVANVAEWVAGQVTLRIVGGSTNGVAFRDSGNARNNFAIADNGRSATLGFNTGASTYIIINAALVSQAAAVTFQAAGVGYWDVGRGSVTGGADFEIANTQLSTRALSIASATSAITFGPAAGTAGVIIDGTGFGAGVASLRFNGLTTGAAAQVGTLTNAPSAGNPNFWLPVSIAGTVRYIPCW